MGPDPLPFADCFLRRLVHHQESMKKQTWTWTLMLPLFLTFSPAFAQGGAAVSHVTTVPAGKKLLVPVTKAATSCSQDSDCPTGKCCWEKDHTCLKCTSRAKDSGPLDTAAPEVQQSAP